MARFEIRGPDGARYEVNAPDGATEQDALAYIQKQQSGGSIAQGVADFGEQAVRGVNRGVNNLLSLPGAVVGGAINMVAPGQGDRFKWNNPVSEVMASPQAQPQSAAGRFGDAIGQAVGMSALPTMGVAAKAQQAAAPAQTAIGQVGQQMVNAYRTAPGAAVAADAAAAVGSGIGQQTAQEMGFGAGGQMIGGMAGGVVPGLVNAGVQAVARPVQRAIANQGRAGAYGSIVDGLPQGLDTFADEIATGATRQNNTTNRVTLDILGEEMARAGGDVNRARVATINRIVAETGVTPQTARDHIRRLTQVHENSPLMLAEYPAVSQSDAAQRLRHAGNVDLDDIGRTQNSTTQYTLDYLANNGNAQSAINARNAVSRRQEDLDPAMRETLQRMAPRVAGTNQPATIVDTENMVEQARQAASAVYRQAYQGPVNNWELVNRLPRVLDAARNFSAGRAGDVRDALNRAIGQFMLDTPNGPVAMGTLQQLQDARAVLRDQIQGLRNNGQNAAAEAVQRLRDQITQIMTRASPTWRRANDQWADMQFEAVARDLGDVFAQKAGPRYREQMRQFQRLAPQAQDIVRVHWLQQQFDLLDNAPDKKALSALFAKDHARNMVRAIFGDDAAIDFTRAVRDQKVAEESSRMMNNSATHRRGVAQEQKDAETGLVAIAQNPSVQAVRNWFLERAKRLLTEQKNRPMADILTTPMSDTARVAQHLHGMRQQEQRLHNLSQPRQVPLAAIGRTAPMLNPPLEVTVTPDPEAVRRRDLARQLMQR